MLSEKLKELRRKKGLSQADLSNIVGVTQQAVGRWEKGKSSPDYDMLKRLSILFNVTTDYLLGNDPNPGYYHDPEVVKIVDAMKDNPGMRVLFDASKGLKKESIEEVRKFIEYQKSKQDYED